MAKQTEIVLTAWEETLQSIARARQPGAVIQSLEENRVIDSIIRAYQWLAVNSFGQREFIVWSPVSLRKIDLAKPNEPENLEPQEFYTVISQFVAALGDAKSPGAVLVLCDAESSLLGPENSRNVRLLREALWSLRGTTRMVLLLNRKMEIPEQVADDLIVLPFELPTAKDLEAVFAPIIKNCKDSPNYKKIQIDEKMVPLMARACAGLPETTAAGLVGLAIARNSAFDVRAVDMALTEKAQIVRRSNVLEYETPHGNLDDIGGLENVKAWIKAQDSTLRDAEAAKSYGLRMPSGLLLTGVSGTGKSLTARMLAAHWKLPLLRMDMGRAFGSLVGQSEANMRQMIQLTNAIGDVIVFIDEIEKALGGRGGELDGGTTDRVKATFLTWLQEKPSGVFVVMTANDVTKFDANPEFLRAGRVDAKFFVDLPDYRARMEILAIHLRKTGHELPAKELEEGAAVARGYSGAELEVSVQTALRMAFNSEPRLPHPTGAMLAAAIRKQPPLSQTMKESIDRLRAWCKDGRAEPAGSTLEDEKKDRASFDKFGLPDLVKA